MKKLKPIIAMMLCASLVLASVACSSSKSGKKKSKGGDGIDEDDASKVAVDFVEALISQDEDELKKLSSEDEEFEFDYDFNDLDAAYKAWFKTFEAEVEDDAVEVDDDEASVTVTVTYADLSSIDEAYSEDDLIDEIEDCEDTKSTEIKIELKSDDDDIIVSNASKAKTSFDKIVDGAEFKLLEDQPIGIDEDIIYVDYEYEIGDTDTIEIEVECYDFDQFEDSEIEIKVEDPDGNTVLEGTLYFHADSTLSLSTTPKTLGLDKWTEGYYSGYAECGDYYYGIGFYVEGSGDEPDPTSTVTPGGDTDLKAAPDDKAGKLDETAGTYENDVFGFRIEFPSDMTTMDPSAFMSGDEDEYTKGIRAMAMTADGDFVAVAVYEGDESVLAMIGLSSSQSGGKDVDCNGITFTRINAGGSDVLYMVKDKYIVMIIAGSADTNDAIMDCISPL